MGLTPLPQDTRAQLAVCDVCVCTDIARVNLKVPQLSWDSVCAFCCPDIPTAHTWYRVDNS